MLWLRSQDCFRAGGEGGDPFKGSWRANVKTQGGGELIDTGYHPSYRLLYLAGSPAVEASTARWADSCSRSKAKTPPSVQVRFANGAIGEILTSWAFPLPHGTHHIHIIGEKGQIFGSSNTLYHLPRGYTEPAKQLRRRRHIRSGDRATSRIACAKASVRFTASKKAGRCWN